MLHCRPPGHIVAALADQQEHRVGPQPVNLREVSAQQGVKRGPYVEVRLIAAFRATYLWLGFGRRRTPFVEYGQRLLDGNVTLLHLELVKVVELKRMPQSEKTIITIVPAQSGLDRSWRDRPRVG